MVYALCMLPVSLSPPSACSSAWGRAPVATPRLPALHAHCCCHSRRLRCIPVQIANAYVDPAAETLVTVKCMPYGNLTGAAAASAVNGLANDTTYTVRLVIEDALK